MKWILLTLASLFIMSCGQTFNTDGGSTQDSQFNAVTCSCSSNYDPVCGYVNSSYVTYTNACLAQCAGVDYTSGLCGQSVSQVNNQSCNSNSGLVCGRPVVTCAAGQVCTTVLPQARYYSNECDMILNGAELVSDSNCD